MRRLLATTIAAAAMAAAGCGDDSPDTAQTTQDQAEQTAQQTPAAAERDSNEIATATQKLADQISQAARELADDPDVNLDERLNSAEQRGNELSKQAQTNLDANEPELATALREANERLAAAAADLRDADSADDVKQVLEAQLTPAAERLAKAAGADQISGADAQRQLEQARDKLEKLRDELPNPDG
jgi:exonuclease VII small subunit